jgi:predicted MFS family arabinose efflux permease
MNGDRFRSPFGYAAVLAAAALCYAALGAVVAILPSYVPDRLGGGSTAIGLAVGAPALTGLIGRPFGGRAADRLGPLRPLLVGAAVMAVGVIPAVLFSTLTVLLLSRLAVGLGEGLMMSATVAWLLLLAGSDRRGRALGHIGLANYGGLALGPLLATALGGARAGTTVLWLAALLPIVGGAAAVGAARVGSGDRLMAADARGAAGLSSTGRLLRQVAPAGVGLLLVNVGYVSVLAFGAELARRQGTGLQTLIVPVFAGVVVVARTLGGSLPDRMGGVRTVAVFAACEAVGLFVYAQSGETSMALAALLILSIGQAMAVPGLGLLALAGVPATDQGAAAGLFFAWFDAGVGFGGLGVGAAASALGPGGALTAAAVAVLAVVLIAVVGRQRWPGAVLQRGSR